MSVEPVPRSRPLGARRQPAALRLPRADARGDGVQAALLRLGARLPVAARPPADALRRALPGLHAVREGRRPVPFYPVVLLGNIVLFTFFQEGTARRIGRRPREPGAEDPLPAHGHPGVRRPHRGVQPVLNLCVVMVFALASGVHRAGRGWRRRCSSRSSPCSCSASRCSFGALRPLPRHQADLGGRAPGALLRDAGDLRGRGDRRVRRLRKLIMMNPVAAILEQFRHAVIDPGAPTAAEAAGGTLTCWSRWGPRGRLRGRLPGVRPRRAADRRRALILALTHAAALAAQRQRTIPF